MDEPTAALTGPRGRPAVRASSRAAARGRAVLFISHRLDEIFAICDTVTVMRDGARRARRADRRDDDRRHGPADGRSRAERAVPEAGRPDRRTVLEVKRLTREGVFFDVSFEVRAGEIVALAGLVGAGRSEVARAIFGIDRPTPATSRSGRRLPPGRRWRRCRPASRSCPRTAACRGW